MEEKEKKLCWVLGNDYGNGGWEQEGTIKPSERVYSGKSRKEWT